MNPAIQHRAKLLAVVASFAGLRTVDSADIVQQVAERYEVTPGVRDPLAWARTVAWRIGASEARAPRNRDRREMPQVAAAASAPRHDINDAVRRTLAQLTDDDRRVLVLKDVEGCTHAEIAERLGIKVGTSRMRLMRARQEFKRIYQEVTQ